MKFCATVPQKHLSKISRRSRVRRSEAAALAGNRLLYRDGIPTAVLIAGDIQFLEGLDEAKEWTAQKELLRGPVQALPISPASHREVRRRRTDEVSG
jgi:hypothetical protein